MECGNFTENAEFCEHCQVPLQTEKSRVEEIKKEYTKRIQKKEEPAKVTVWINRLKNHPNIFVQVFGYIINSVVVAILFLVSVISYIVAFIVSG